MIDYIDILKIEAKGLLKDFQKKDEQAIERCAKYFSGHDDLSLMNVQHVIAKEYGFDSWNDIVKRQNWEIADFIKSNKNRKLSAPLIGRNENTALSLRKPSDSLDFSNFTERCRNGYISELFPIERTDVSEYDLSKMDLINVSFDEETLWPNEENKLPKGGNPKKFLEYRKNPGLGIRDLHKQGIDGRNRNVAIIDCMRLTSHFEYIDNLVDYIEIGKSVQSAPLEGRTISALVGKNCGIVPKANLYYIRVDDDRNLTDMAKALEKVCEIHQNLLTQGKNGIDVVSISAPLMMPMFENYTGYKEFVKVYEKSSSMGIWVNIARNEPKPNMNPIIEVACKADGDVNSPSDYVSVSEFKMPPDLHDFVKKYGKFLAIPARGRTVANCDGVNSYIFDSSNYYQKSFENGLFVMARSIKNDISAKEFWKLIYDTGDNIMVGSTVLINPVKMIEALKKRRKFKLFF